MSDATPRVGSQFGPYLLKRLLGRGGMGEVYEAFDTVMKRTVALKLVSAEYSQDPRFRKRLEREARVAGRLREPHVVPIHNYGEVDGQLYVDMHFIEGTDLDTVLRRHGPLAAPRAVAIVRQIASALDAAHRAGVLHRDVKPANVLLTGDDFAYLVDFGIASAVTEEKLTKLGDIIGTWSYMAPERFTGHNDSVTERADTYALACVLFECLTGSAPYQGSRASVMAAHMSQPVPRPSSLRPAIPVAFDQVIAKGMAKSPEDRFDSAGDFALAANGALATTDQHEAADILRRSQAATMPPAWSAPPAQTPYSWPAQTPAPQWPLTPAPAGPHQKHSPWIWVSVSILAVVAILGGLGIWLGTRHTPTISAGESKTTTAPPTSTHTSTTAPANAAVSRLLELMPSGYKCYPQNPPFPHALASVGCDVNVLGGSPSISGLIYSLYSDSAVLKSEFYNLLQGDKVVACPGDTTAPSDWHKAANPLVTVGQVGCATYVDSPEVVWTNVYNNLIGIAQGDKIEQVYKWWQNNS